MDIELIFFFDITFCVKWNRAVKRSNCFHKHGEKAPCIVPSTPYMIMFGVIEIIFSQIPNFDQIWWLSIVAAVMSFTYSAIGLGLGVAQVAGLFKNFVVSRTLQKYCHLSQLCVRSSNNNPFLKDLTQIQQHFWRVQATLLLTLFIFKVLFCLTFLFPVPF